MNLKQDKNNFWYYTKLPENTRVATYSDFFIDKRLLLGKPFIIKSEIHPNHYWANRTKEGFPYIDSDFLTFLERKEVFIFCS